jgi:hypothetical protein
LNPEDPGYSIRDHVFSRTDMAGVGQALADATVERTKAGARHVLKGAGSAGARRGSPAD